LTTINETIRDLQRQFAESGIDTARLDAELLVGHALGISRTQILANLRDPFPDDLASATHALADRRLGGEPVAYILGRKEFLGRDFIVTPAVLTPRPETELLVEWAVTWLSKRPDAKVVDVGTGSGAIAIGVALNTPPTVSITAVDVSEDALAVARGNADQHCPDRISFQPGDLLSGVQGRFDLVLANLPYLRPDQIDGNRDLVAEPRLALDGGQHGLDLIDRLIGQLPDALDVSGAVALEIDPSQSIAVAERLAASLPDAAIAVHKDLAGLDRFVTAVRI
jgi:release factor glutamine methyltransferase